MNITSIDPEPRSEIDSLCNTVVRSRLEDISPSFFDSMQKGDVLFFDGSHRCFQGSDVTVFFMDILPRLQNGVTVGIQDIFLPFDYPSKWTRRFYNEQYLLGTALLYGPEAFNILFASHFVQHFMQAEISAALPADLLDYLPPLSGGCFWFNLCKD